MGRQSPTGDFRFALFDLKQFRQGHAEGMREMLKIPQGWVPLAELDPRQIDAMDLRFFGKALLRPAFSGSQLPNTLCKRFSGRRRRRRGPAFQHSQMVFGSRKPLNKL
jgi:hypothetical protein